MNDYVLRSDILKTLLCILVVLLVLLIVNRVHMWLLWRRWVRERVAKLREIEAKEPKKEQDDPCDTCLRWPECNGADRDTCPNCETALHLVPCPKCGGQVSILYCCGEHFISCENGCMDIPACFHSSEKATAEEWNGRARNGKAD